MTPLAPRRCETDQVSELEVVLASVGKLVIGEDVFFRFCSMQGAAAILVIVDFEHSAA